MQSIYTPGVCNIGPDEIRMRYRFGWIGLAVTIILGVVLFALDVAPWIRIILVLPACAAAMGLLQASMHFCVAFAAKGLFNMDKAAGKTESVSQAEFRKADQKKAIQIWTYAILIALVVGIIAFFI